MNDNLAQSFSGGEKEYRSLLGALDATAIVSVTDSTGNILYVNDLFVEISKYPRAELIGKNHRILKSGHQSQELFDTLWRTISSGKVWRGEIKNRAKDGTYYWVDTSIAPVVGPNGKPERYISVRFLITNRKQLEEQVEHQVADLERTKTAMLNLLEDLDAEKKNLEKEKAKDEAILLSLGDALVATDRDGKIVLVNRVFEESLGWTESEAKGRPVTDLVSMYDENKNPIPYKNRPVQIALETHAPHTTAVPSTHTAYYKRRTGELFPVTYTVAPIIAEGTTIGMVEVFRDITREQEVDHAKSEFVSLASHQLRTPLSTINWYAEMLVAGDAGPLSEDQKRYVEEIYRGNQRMVDLVNALLNVSRLELGTFAVDPKPTDIVKLAKDVILELEPKVFERKIDLEEEYAPGIPVMSVDPNLMRIIFQNLLSNAVKYTPPEGKVSLLVDIDEHGSDEKRLRIKVTDTGYGIPKEAQSKIFTKLYRADNVRVKETDGTGLGLYIIKSIVENVSGDIAFVSAENKGSTFTVHIPLSGMRKKEGTKTLGG